MLLNLTDYHRPRTIDEALALLDDTTRPLAGGTGLVASQNPRLAGVVDLRGLGLDGHEQRADGALALGATLRLADLAGIDGLARRHDGTLLEAARTSWPSLGKRHLATLGGRLWDAGQRSLLGALMVALEARFVLAGEGNGEPLAAAAFYRRPRPVRALLLQVVLPADAKGDGTALETLRAIPSAVPILGVAVSLRVENGRVVRFHAAIGPGAERPWPIDGLAEHVTGEPADELPYGVLRGELPEKLPLLEDSRGSALYRRRILPVLLERATRRALAAAEARR